MKKTIALLLAVCVLVCLCACGKTTIVSYDSQVDDTDTASLDYAAAWAAHEPEAVVFTVDGVAVTWQELFYEICYCARYVESQESKAITDWNATCTLYTDADGNYYTYNQVVMDNAISMLVQYHVMDKYLADAGVTMGEESQNYVETVEQNAIENSFGGDRDKFLAYLDEMHCTEELWLWFNKIDAMYQYDGYTTLYGKNGEKLSDAETLAYADEYGYVQIQQIYLYLDDETDEAERLDFATTMVDKLNACQDSEELASTFYLLYQLYNENEDLDVYPGGWCLFEGDTDDAVYEAARELEDYTAMVVDTGTALVVVVAVPVETDAVVAYDTETDTAYTLRYYAAWQAYSNLINNDDGWIASADVQWAEGFETFSLPDIF